MNNESMLQREFKSKDVQRMRNIITKNHNAKTTTQIGYTKKHVDHSEGDVWEEDGKKWTIKNGVKQTVTRFDSLKKLISIPLTCPKCHNAMKPTTLNKKMWPIHGTCFDCVIETETELKRQGKFDEYARNLISRGVKTYIQDLEDALLDLSSESNNDFITEHGDVEKWTGKGVDTKKITVEIQEHIQELRNHINI